MTDQPTPKPLTAEEEKRFREDHQYQFGPFSRADIERLLATLDASRAESAALRAAMTNQQMTKEVCPHCDRTVYQMTTTNDDILDDPRVDKEVGRWQDTIKGALDDWMTHLPLDQRREVDGAGCESGDPLDVTLAEVNITLGAYLDTITSLRAAVAEAEKQMDEAKNDAAGIREYCRKNIEDAATLIAKVDAAEKDRDALAAELAAARKALTYYATMPENKPE